jgi:hypothetical protein
MLGRRDPQHSLFDADNLPHCVPPESFYGRMATVSDVLFKDDDLTTRTIRAMDGQVCRLHS